MAITRYSLALKKMLKDFLNGLKDFGISVGLLPNNWVLLQMAEVNVYDGCLGLLDDIP